MALLEGPVDNGTYASRNLRSERNLRFLKKVSVREDPALTALYPARGMGNRVTVVTRSGGTISKEVVVPRGHPLDPMSREEVEDKFRRLTKGKLPRRTAEELLGRVWSLEEVREVGDLVPLLKVSAG